MLVVLLLYLNEILEKCNDIETKILVCSATNTAVDRVLLGLLQLNFQGFVRIGSLRKIAKKILPFTLSSEDKEAMKDLQVKKFFKKKKKFKF